MKKDDDKKPTKGCASFEKSYDLVVVGSDPAGFFCSLSAAREGLKVLHVLSQAAPLCPEWMSSAMERETLSPIDGSLPKEFFIQKAIGWALREYAKHNRKAVEQFIQKATLMPLSIREAQKHF